MQEGKTQEKEFSLLHDLFASIATELDAYTDLLAERIAVLGGVARGTAAVYTDIAWGVEKRLWGLEAYLQG